MSPGFVTAYPKVNTMFKGDAWTTFSKVYLTKPEFDAAGAAGQNPHYWYFVWKED